MKSASRLPAVISFVLSASLLLFCIWIPTWDLTGKQNLVRLILLMAASTLALYSYAGFFKVNSRPIFRKALTSVFSLLIVFLFLEGIFMFVFVTDRENLSLASRNWFRKHWGAMNSHGFRDVEPDLSQPGVLFIGDSYTEGHGILRQERYSDIIREKMKQTSGPLPVINIGFRGLDTAKELQLLQNFLEWNRYKPKVVVWQYCFNDVEGIAAEHGKTFQASDGTQPRANPFVRGSYLLNYLYYRLAQKTSGYLDWLASVYSDPAIMKDQLVWVDEFSRYCKSNDIGLIFVCFPLPSEITWSRSAYIHSCDSVVKQYGHPVIDITSAMESLPVSARSVNPSDAHPSEEVNRILADSVWAYLNPHL